MNELILVLVFVAGYGAIACEHAIKINKTATALLLAVCCWALITFQSYCACPVGSDYIAEVLGSLNRHLHDVAQIIVFLIGAMTIVELIDSYGGFRILTDFIRTKNKRKLLWVIAFVTFFLSAVLDNLTTAIVMISLIRRLVPERADRLVFACIVIIAANAGGAWSPIGDVTTTMLWIGGQVTAGKLMVHLFIPSVVSLLVPLCAFSFALKAGSAIGALPLPSGKKEIGAKRVFFLGIGTLIFVPIFRMLTNLPPFMGMMFGLGVMWVLTDIIHHGREKLNVPSVLTRVDFSSVLFFLGIILAIGALETAGILKQFAAFMDRYVANKDIIVSLMGALSAIIDNVPLTAAAIGMYPLSVFPVDAKIWPMLAYGVGTGGSMLIIGSAAGVVVMGLEKIDFFWYLKKASFVTLLGYFAGILAFLALYPLLG